MFPRSEGDRGGTFVKMAIWERGERQGGKDRAWGPTYSKVWVLTYSGSCLQCAFCKEMRVSTSAPDPQTVRVDFCSRFPIFPPMFSLGRRNMQEDATPTFFFGTSTLFRNAICNAQVHWVQRGRIEEISCFLSLLKNLIDFGARILSC